MSMNKSEKTMSSTYFHPNNSIFSRFYHDVESIVEAISSRYIGSNPPHPFKFRAFCRDGFIRQEDYRYVFDLEQRYPTSEYGQFVYAWSKYWSDENKDITLSVTSFGPVQLYINNELVFKSSIVDELDAKRKANIVVPVQEGWNHIILRFTHSPTGFGGIVGTGRLKRFPFHFLTPSEERFGQEGWIYTEPLDEELKTLPSEGDTESSMDVKWYPDLNVEHGHLTQLKRIFGLPKKQFAIAWTKIANQSPILKTVILEGEHKGKIEVVLNHDTVYKSNQSSRFQLELTIPYGQNDLVVKSTCTEDEWGFQLDKKKDEIDIEFTLPAPVEGARDCWLYVGAFPENSSLNVSEMLRLDTLFNKEVGSTYWRLDMPNTWVRPYLENPLFGKWDYPLGVTLYGLLETGRVLNRKDIVEYALKHIEQCTSYYPYSLWDREQYGAAAINTQLSGIDSLDDCGSFGATMLTAQDLQEIKNGDKVADDIAEHITNIQDRLPNQTLYRKFGSVEFMKDTIWCDDLYMSTPFLCRYYKKTGDLRYIDDAVNQFLRYKEFLFIPDKQIMSHVYDFKFNKATLVPWGRGNGWVIFSLAELLEILPEDHESQVELRAFFRELANGFLKLQGKNGLWHQVLTDSESYEESSCTSMFIYAFSKGIRNGWIEAPDAYIKAAFKGWEGLSKNAIDQNGNIYGVCQGSGYSFTPEYYKHDLTWILNDTHGIGIVLIAGIETIKLQRWLAQKHEISVAQ